MFFFNQFKHFIRLFYSFKNVIFNILGLENKDIDDVINDGYKFGELKNEIFYLEIPKNKYVQIKRLKRYFKKLIIILKIISVN